MRFSVYEQLAKLAFSGAKTGTPAEQASDK
jgi:hypothetical protein